MAARVAQLVTVIDRSNKVVGNSKQFKDVWKDAKSAYLERKQEIKAKKAATQEAELAKAIAAVSLAEESEYGHSYHDRRPAGPRRVSTSQSQTQYSASQPQSRTQSRTQSRRVSPTGERPRASRQPSIHQQDYHTSSPTSHHIPLGDFNNDLYGPNPIPGQLTRSRTDPPQPRASPLRPSRSMEQFEPYWDHTDVDPALAYGEHYPEDLVGHVPSPRSPYQQQVIAQDQKQKELGGLISKCKSLLDEADCTAHSAKAIITHLQRNPDTLAAVGLTLAEISAVAKTMAPGALGAFAKSAPAVLALLVSSEFLIAVGLAAGVTVIALGGYKIVKKIIADKQDKAALEGGREMEAEEAIDVHELDKIDRWRRGIPETALIGGGRSFDDVSSVISGSSVEGELITPFAARSMGHLPVKEKKSKKEGRDKEKNHRRRKTSGDGESTRSSSGSRRGSETGKERALVKVKKPSPLSRMFSSKDSTRS